MDSLYTIQEAIRTLGAGTDYSGMQAYAARNRAFHEEIFRANGNEVLTEIYHGLNYHVLIEHVFHSYGVTDVPEVIAEHDAILEALAAREPDAAEAAMRAHIEHGSSRLLQTYGEQDGAMGAKQDQPGIGEQE
jgi:DNA-binding GntR family transcriptional regulator